MDEISAATLIAIRCRTPWVPIDPIAMNTVRIPSSAAARSRRSFTRVGRMCSPSWSPKTRRAPSGSRTSAATPAPRSSRPRTISLPTWPVAPITALVTGLAAAPRVTPSAYCPDSRRRGADLQCGRESREEAEVLVARTHQPGDAGPRGRGAAHGSRSPDDQALARHDGEGDLRLPPVRSDAGRAPSGQRREPQVPLSSAPVPREPLPAASLEQLFGPQRAGREAAHRAAETARHARQDLRILEVRRRL